VATSSDRSHFELKTRRHLNWFKIFEAVVLGDDPAVRRGKPAPDIFLVAARRLGVSPSRCLVFEDSPAGVEAACSAGMKVIAVPDPNMERLAYGMADSVIDTLEDFDPVEWNLPAYPPRSTKA
jgi:pseudouridine-5'-monophosphatase